LMPGRKVFTWRRDWSVVEAAVVRLREFPDVAVEVESDGRSWQVETGHCQPTRELALLAAREAAARAVRYLDAKIRDLEMQKFEAARAVEQRTAELVA
jgi:hypothetical protein